MRSEEFSPKSVLQGVFMLLSSAIVAFDVGTRLYSLFGVATSIVFFVLYDGRWRKKGRPQMIGVYLGLVWPSLVLSSYWIVRKEESERRERMVTEVMLS